MKYRKKPIIIEAFQYDGDLKGSDGKYIKPIKVNGVTVGYKWNLEFRRN